VSIFLWFFTLFERLDWNSVWIFWEGKFWSVSLTWCVGDVGMRESEMFFRKLSFWFGVDVFDFSVLKISGTVILYFLHNQYVFLS
jgi:hypothetical protein